MKLLQQQPAPPEGGRGPSDAAPRAPPPRTPSWCESSAELLRPRDRCVRPEPHRPTSAARSHQTAARRSRCSSFSWPINRCASARTPPERPRCPSDLKNVSGWSAFSSSPRIFCRADKASVISPLAIKSFALSSNTVVSRSETSVTASVVSSRAWPRTPPKMRNCASTVEAKTRAHKKQSGPAEGVGQACA